MTELVANAREATEAEDVPLGSAVLSAAAISFAYPWVMLASVYVTWFVAWAALGHRPRPSLDDPKSIGTAVDIPYHLSGLFILAAPGAVLFGAFASVAVAWSLGRTSSSKLGYSLFALMAFAALWCGAIVFLRADPWHVLTWYFD